MEATPGVAFGAPTLEEDAVASTARPETGGRRDQLVAAAAAVLARQGYGDTSLKDVAHEAGVAVGLLHYYFESKQHLLLEVVAIVEADLDATWREAVSGSEDPLERVVRGLNGAANALRERPDVWRLLFDLSALGMGSGPLRERLQGMRARRVEQVESEVRQVLGRLPAYSVAVPGQLAEALIAAIDGIALSALLTGRDLGPASNTLKTMLLSLVVTAYVTAGLTPPIDRLSELLELGSPGR